MPGQATGYVIPCDSRHTGVNAGKRLQAFVLPFFRLERKVKIASPITGEPYGAAAEGDPGRSPQKFSARMMCGRIVHLP